MEQDSFTDEQLLNLVNNTIISKTNFLTNQFTGGYVSITSTHGHSKQTYKAVLLFGYEAGNSKTYKEEISEDLVFIWVRAIITKIMSIKVVNIGQNLSDLNSLMNIKKEEKKEVEDSNSTMHSTITHCTSTSTLIPKYLNTSTSIREIKTFLDVKDLLIENKRETDIDGKIKHVRYNFEGKEIALSDSNIPYFLHSTFNLTHGESDRFYKSILTEYQKSLIDESNNIKVVK